MLSADQKAAAFDRIAELAPSLNAVEIKVLIALTREAKAPHFSTKIGGRSLAKKARIGHSGVQRAIGALQANNIITTRQGTATEGTGFILNFLKTLPIGVPISGTPPVPKTGSPDPKTGTPMSLFQVQGVPISGTHPGVPMGEDHHARTRVDSDSIPIPIFDRVYLHARPKHFERSELDRCREWLHGYMCKFGTADIQPSPHPPDDDLCAKFLTIESWPVLERLLYDMMAERQECYSPGWFLTIGLQRIHGISPPEQKRKRAQLREVKREKASAAAAAATPSPTQRSFEDFNPKDLAKQVAKKLHMGRRA